MSARPQIIALLVTMLGSLAWLTSATPAQAGGPWSVHMLNAETGRAKALSGTDKTFLRLERAIGGYGPDVSSRHKPAPVGEDFGHEIRLAWLFQDMHVWRIDRVHRTTHDGIWVETVVDVENVAWDRAGVWHRPADQNALLAVFVAAGLLPGSARPAGTPTTRPAPGAPTMTQAAPTAVQPVPAHVETSRGRAATLALMAATGAAGLILGAAGAVAVIRPTRRVRPARRPRPDRLVLTD